MLSKSFFARNRKSFSSKMVNSAIAVFFARDQILKGDSEFFDFCDPNIFYLTGIEQAHTKLILCKDNKGVVSEYLFIQETSKLIEVWEGKKLSKKEVSNISGVKKILYLEEFEKELEELIKRTKVFYFFNDKKIKIKYKSEYDLFVQKTKRKFKRKYVNSFEILRNLRQIKSQEEISEIKKAMEVTREGHMQILKNLRFFKNERDIEAALSYIYTKNFCKHSYHPIVAQGENTCILHYIKNDHKLQKNSLLLVDSGAERNNYKTDITRTYPISGKFTKRQIEVYEAVLNIQRFAIKGIKPNLNIIDWERNIIEKVSLKLVDLKLVSQEQVDRDKKIVREFYPHSTGHFLGLDTHDIGDYKVFKEGMIYTVEPGIYIKNENIGVRIEDNILVTKNGCEVLSKSIPKSIKEIERVANK